MAKYSLINVSKVDNGLISGYWLQDCACSLSEAKKRASETEAVNSNKITVSVVDQLNTTTPQLEYFTGLKQL